MHSVFRRLRNRSLVDFLVLVASLWAAYLLRFDFVIPAKSVQSALTVTPFVVTIQMLILRRFGVHRVVGRYVSFDDIGAFAQSAVVWLVPMLSVRLFLPDGLWRIPLAVSLMDTVLATIGLVGVRLAQRIRAEVWNAVTPLDVESRPVLLVGAGDAGAKVAREIRRSHSDLRVAGFVDDDLHKHGSVISAAQVVGSTADIPRLVVQFGIDHVIVTMVDPSSSVMKRIVRICGGVPIRVRTVPSFLEIVQGTRSLTSFLDVDIEDLLGREPVELDSTRDLAAYLHNRVVMVTGAGGSIGSELARQVAEIGPEALLLVERFEGALFEIHRELAGSHSHIVVVPLVADITDRDRMHAIFDLYEPEVVVHAAAHKHVAMMEDNPGEAIKNNTFGTRLIAEMAGGSGVCCFVLVSTDKAVRPTSIMGASKRLAEMVVQRCDSQYEGTRFVAVRFGNVMGSSGSVIPIFREQVLHGGPVTVTHEEASRYFMTISEASRLVLTAGAIGRGGEVMVLDMGQPVRIIDLARNLITLSGFVPDEDIPIQITGLKQGEKLNEELYTDTEDMELTRHPKIFVGRAREFDIIDQTLHDLEGPVLSGDGDEIRAIVGLALVDSRLLASG